MEPTDEELLAATPKDPASFAVFYRRHARPVAGFFVRRTNDPELAADLTAETFAAALRYARRFDPDKGVAAAWLYGIARNQLADALAKGRADDRARRAMRIPPIALDDEDLERIASTADSTATEALAALPAEQRAAVEARVVHERDYAAIAAADGVSEAVVRKRVSRGLAGLRRRLEERP